MRTITVSELERDFQAYLRRVGAGESFVIVDAEKPVAELRPVSVQRRGPRPFGLCAGQFRVPDDCNEPLPEEIARLFEGK